LALISIVGRLPNTETPAKLTNRDESLLIVLVNVVGFFGGTVLPDELGDTNPVVSATDWDYAATAALADMLALVFEDPLVSMQRFPTEEPERDGKPCRWFIPSGRPETGGINQHRITVERRRIIENSLAIAPRPKEKFYPSCYHPEIVMMEPKSPKKKGIYNLSVEPT
jgi:hypothetical protein